MHFESEYNLGNAHYGWRNGDLPFYITNGLHLSPSNADLKTNLTLANAQIKDRIESLPSNGILDIWAHHRSVRYQLWARLMILAGRWVRCVGVAHMDRWHENRRLLGSSAVVLIALGLACMLMTQRLRAH